MSNIFEYAPAPESRAIVDIKPSYGLFIDGEFVDGTGTAFKTVNPATEEVLAEVAEASDADVDAAVKAAGRAYTRVWSRMPGSERAKYLYRIARIIQERGRELAVLESIDNGKPIKESRDVDVPIVAAHFFYYAGWADKLQYSGYGSTPLGVAGQVIPWNFPLMMLAWKIAPALACGNTVVLKPAETTPLTALLFAEICQQADLPPGVVNIVTGAGDTGRAIVSHPDVRLMLMRQKAWAEGLRALVLYTASQQDRVELTTAGGEVDDLAVRLNDLLLPVVKGYGSEKAYELLASSLQVLGGSGFTQDYPIEQYIRDAKIDSLYEGTTAIQAQDFFFRKIVRDNGQALMHVAGQVQAFLDAEGGNGRVKEERALLATALGDVQAMLGSMVGYLTSSQEDVTNLYKVGQNTTRLLMALGDVVTGWLLVRQAEVALARLAEGQSGRERAFYQGKVAAARFFCAQVLPPLSAQRAIAESIDNDLMDLPEDAF